MCVRARVSARVCVSVCVVGLIKFENKKSKMYQVQVQSVLLGINITR